MTVEDRLRRAVPPDAEDARDRGWAVVRAAQPAPQQPRHRLVSLIAAAAAAGALVLTGGAATAAEWVADRVAPERATSPARVQLPTAGRLLVADRGGLALIRQDGSRVKLPAADGAIWSPNGLFIAAWHKNELRATEPDGDPRWRITTKQPIQTAVWSPDGLRIAYVAGNRIRIVSGNGTNDHRLIGGATTSTRLAWNPQRPQELAFITGDGIFIRDVGTGRLVKPRGRHRWARAIMSAVSSRGRLAVTDGDTLRVDGRALLTVRGLAGTPVWSPDGRYLAVGRGRSILLVSADGQRLSTVAGGLPLAWAR